MSGGPIDMTDFDFRVRRPAGELGRFVESIWYARGTVPYRREQIAPTGSCVAVFVLGAPILEGPLGGELTSFERGFLVGPHDQPVVNEPTAETFAVGIVTTAVGSLPVLGVPPRRVRGAVVDLELAWSDAATLREQLRATVDPDAMVDLVEAHLLASVDPGVAGIERCEHVVDRLIAEPTTPIARIAGDVGISHGHLDREFTRLTGLSPRVLARLLRVRLLLEGIDAHGSPAWSDLAAELGWFDQAHLIRDFKRHTGVTPTEYVRRQQRFEGAADAAETAGFVPDDEAREPGDIKSVQDSP